MTRGRRTKPTSLHRDILAQAWARTWSRKRVWVFAWLAAILSTGGAFEVALRAFQHLREGETVFAHLLTGSLPSAAFLAASVQSLAGIHPGRLAAVLALIALAAILLLLVAAAAQGALLHGLAAKPSKSNHDDWKAGHAHRWSLIEINLLTKIAIVCLSAGISFPLFYFVTHPNLTDGFVLAFLLAIFFPLTITIATVGMLALIRATQTGDHGFTAIAHAWRFFRAHAASAFELGLILFCLMFALGTLGTAILLIASIPFTAIAALALLSHAPFLLLVVGVVGFIALFLVILVAGAGAVTFQYAAWVAFYERICHPKALLHVVSKTRRIWNAL